MPDRRKNGGFTIIEVLVAIALFAIVILVVLVPLTGLFGLTQKSAQQTSATNLAQQTMETIRGQWLNANRYGNNCVLGPLPSTPSAPVVTVQGEDVQGNPLRDNYGIVIPPVSPTVGNATTCPAVAPVGTTPPAGPPLRLITVKATVNGGTSTLVAEVSRSE